MQRSRRSSCLCLRRLFSHKRGKRVSMLIMTPYWLDKASFDVHPVGENKCTVTAFSRSTGVLPVVLPFSFLLNTLFFWRSWPYRCV